MNDGESLTKTANFFAALMDPTRLRLLNLMREDEVCVGFLAEVTGESQPKISRHLAYLRNAGIVSARREGKWISYKIESPENPYAADLLENALRWLKAQPKMREEYDKLTALNYDSENHPVISRAPIPHTFARKNMNEQAKEELATFLL